MAGPLNHVQAALVRSPQLSWGTSEEGESGTRATQSRMNCREDLLIAQLESNSTATTTCGAGLPCWGLHVRARDALWRQGWRSEGGGWLRRSQHRLPGINEASFASATEIGRACP